METYIKDTPVQISELLYLNRLQSEMVEWASAHSRDAFFQKFFGDLKQETAQHYAGIALFPAIPFDNGELRTLRSEWQGLVNLADMRTAGMRSADFFEILDKLFALELKTVKSALKLYRLNENLRTVLDSYFKEISLLREAMAFLEQYENIFKSTKVSALPAEMYRTA